MNRRKLFMVAAGALLAKAPLANAEPIQSTSHTDEHDLRVCAARLNCDPDIFVRSFESEEGGWVARARAQAYLQGWVCSAEESDADNPYSGETGEWWFSGLLDQQVSIGKLRVDEDGGYYDPTIRAQVEGESEPFRPGKN